MKDHKTYSLGDTQHFHELMRFPATASERSAGNVDPEAADMPTAAHYSDADLGEFRKLTIGDDGRGTLRQTAGASRQPQAAEPAYSKADRRQFDEFLNTELSGLSSSNEAKGPSDDTPSPSIEYSRADLEQFRRLAGESQDDQEPAPIEQQDRKALADRDVGHIKIIDFDEHHERSRQRKRLGKTDMEIRFFD